jgi:hypothetical protein
LTDLSKRSKGRGPRGPRRDSADAFFPEPGEGPASAPDDWAEELAEEFLTSATTGQGQGEEGHEQFVEEEIGGPFILTARREFAHGEHASSVPGAEREPYPTPGPLPQDSPPDNDE